jgi:hypothetical protein
MPRTLLRRRIAGKPMKVAQLVQLMTMAGIEYWQMRDAPAAAAGPSPVHLLPGFDEYTVAYADRTAAADALVLPSISHGLAANILINGRIAGTWKRILRGDDTVAFMPALLRVLKRKEQAGLAAAAECYAAFIGRKLAGSTGRRTPSRKGSPQQSELRA